MTEIAPCVYTEAQAASIAAGFMMLALFGGMFIGYVLGLMRAMKVTP